MKRFFFLLSLLISVSIGTMWGATTYEQLTSIASIDENASYVLGIDGTGFHYEGTSSWGKTALPSAKTAIVYTLKKANDGNSFTAKATISGTTYYLQVPTSNTFSMATSTGTNTDLIIGTTQVSGTNYAVANKTTTNRHLRINGTSGLRSYAGTTGTMAFFYKVVTSGPTLTSIAVSGTPSTTIYEGGSVFDVAGLKVTGTYSDQSATEISDAITWKARTSEQANDAVALANYTLTEGQTSLQVQATVSNITSAWYTVNNLTVTAAPSKSSLTFTAKCNGSGTADDDAVWTVTSDADESTFDNVKGIHYGTSNAAVSYLKLVTNSIHGTIKKVVVNTSGASGTSAVISVKVGTTDFTIGENYTTSPILATAADYTFTGSESGQILVNISQTSAAKAIYCKSIVVTYESNGKGEADLAYDEEDQKQLIKLGNELAVPALGNPHNLDVTYASSNTNVAEVDAEDGTVTIKAAGVAVITASFDGNDNYNEGSASYTIGATTHEGTELDPYDVADAKIVIDVLGTQENAYVSGIISQVDEYLSNYKSITYWISDDGETTDQLKVYSGKGIDGADFSSVNDVALKDIVVVKGTLKDYNNTHEFDKNNELVSLEKPAVPTVTLKQSGTIVTELNAEATGVANQAIDIESTNFANTISSVTARLYSESACENEVTSGAWVTDITINAAKDKVTFNIADNASDARQVWMKVTASDGTNQASAVLAISQARYSVDYATLPFAFDGGRADIANTNGITQEGLDSDYGSSPKLKFNSTNDVVIVKINENPGKLTYDIKNNSFSGGTFTVQESEDGENYTIVATHTEITGTQNEEVDLKQATRYVKFIYTEKVSGNVALGNITISKYVAPAVKPTITTQPVGAEYAQGATAAALTIVAEAAIEGELSYQWYRNSSESTEGAAAIDGATEDEYTPSTAELGTIYYYCVVTEAGADEPTTSNIVAIAVSAAPEPTGTFELFTSDLVEGYYVICDGTNAMKNTVTSKPRLEYATVTVSNNQITNPDEGLVWKVEALTGDDAGYFTIYNEAVEKYAAFTTGDGEGTLLSEVTNYAKWQLNSDKDFTNKGKTGKVLRKNSTYGFASYGTGTGNTLTLYKKKVEGQPAIPTFTVASGTYTSAQTVGIECETEGVAIYYTTDGTTTPTSESTPYTGSISVSETTTIKAIAIKNNISSDVASATYTIVVIEHAGTANDPYTVADARNAIDVDGDLSDKYVSGIISQVDSYNSTYKSITYWISDDGETTSPQLEVYSGKGLDGADFSSKDDLQTGDIVVINGTLKLYESTYEFDKNNQLVSYAKPNVPTVTLKQSGSIVTILNAEATNVANQVIDVECANFASAISSVNAKLYEESTCETEITSGAWVTDITVNGAKDQLTFNIADNAGDARQVWMKVTASDGTNEASTILAISQAKSAFATLPFAFDGGKADIANAGGMTQNGLGTDYNNSPKLKFDNTNDNLIIRINEAPGKLTYDIKNNSFSGGTFTIQESVDGETYTEVASHTEIENTQNEEVELKQATRYVKFIYTEKSNGNVGLGNITISKYVNPDPELNYENARTGLTVGKFYTICMPRNILGVRGATFWNLNNRDESGSMVYFVEAEASLDAGKPYIFIATAETLEVAYGEDVAGSPVDNGALRGTFSAMTQDDFDAVSTDNDDSPIYMLVNNQLRQVAGRSGNSLGANRAYVIYKKLQAGEPTPAPGRRVMAMPMNENVATGIDALGSDAQPSKIIVNGQLFIIRDGKAYDATGRQVSKF